MPRKPRRRPVHYTTITFPIGAVMTCTPRSKPLPKQIKEERLQIDADYVCEELQFSPEEFDRLPDTARAKFSDLMANRINMRRAIREIVMPVLAEVQSSLEQLNQRLSQMERLLKQSSSK